MQTVEQLKIQDGLPKKREDGLQDFAHLHVFFFETETEFHSIMKREYNKEIKEKHSGREA